VVEVGENVDGRTKSGSESGSESEELRKKPRGGVFVFLREIAVLVGLALVLTFVTQTFLGRVYKIPSGSMEQTLHGCAGCTGDRVLVDKLSYDFTDIEPGDVIVFTRPPSWRGSAERPNIVAAWWRDLRSGLGLGAEDGETLIKRVIAMGGQTVQCCDGEGRVMVNGKSLNEPYVYYIPGTNGQKEFGPVKVPEGQLWMMGDSRNNSADSRYDDQGPIPVDNVVGKARLVLFPLDRWKTVDSKNPQG
jgi:signal peptidase I